MSAPKFGRNYRLIIQPNTGTDPIVITPPFTLELDVLRNLNTSQNVATFRIFNLARRTRDNILLDFWDKTRKRTVILQAGYGTSSSLPFVYVGTLFWAFSRREGVNFVTELSCLTGVFQAGAYYKGQAFPANTSYKAIISTLVSNLATAQGYTPGVIGSFPRVTKTRYAPSKPIYQELQELSGNGVYIDNGVINVLNNTESAPPPDVPLRINSATGLLETPMLSSTGMVLQVLFAPEVSPGQLIIVDSSTIESDPTSKPLIDHFNGLQKISSVHHRGVISDAVCGDLRTEIGVYWGIPAVGQT